MKIMRCLWVLLAMALFVSCEKDEELIPEGKVRIDFQLSVYDVYKNLTDIKGKPCFDKPMTDSHRFRVAVFLYRTDEGIVNQLTERKVALLDDARAEVRFRMEPAPGEYLAISTVDVVEMEGDSVKTKYNDVVIYLEAAKINVEYRKPGGYYNAAGSSVSQKISLKQSGQRATVKLNLKPVGSLITFCFHGFDPENSGEISYSIPYAFGYTVAYFPQLDNVFYDVFSKPVYGTIRPTSGRDAVCQQNYLIPLDGVVEFAWGAVDAPGNLGKFNCAVGENKFVKVNVQTNQVQTPDEIAR